CLQTKNCPRTF
nr:immunoglobulin light chain junction region [Macaca mulatta]